jgi:hypothetical protein
VVAERAALCRRTLKLVEGKGPCVLVIGPCDVGLASQFVSSDNSVIAHLFLELA